MLGSPKYNHRQDEIEINAGRRSVTILVSNTGDRAVQVGSHYHFFETNKALLFERELAYGMHLDLPAGTGVRFEAGDTKEVTLTAFAGSRHLIGFNNLVDGGLDSEGARLRALALMTELEYKNGKPTSRPGAVQNAAVKNGAEKTSTAKTGSSKKGTK